MILLAGEQVIAAGFGRERKVRTPPGSMPRKTRGGGGRKSGATESVTENIPPAAPARASQVRVKRRGKSPPPGAQVPGHDKPHAVQDITGSMARLGRPTPAIARSRWSGSFRVIVALVSRKAHGDPRKRVERNDHPRCGQLRRDRIRLIAHQNEGAFREEGAFPFLYWVEFNGEYPQCSSSVRHARC